MKSVARSVLTGSRWAAWAALPYGLLLAWAAIVCAIGFDVARSIPKEHWDAQLWATLIGVLPLIFLLAIGAVITPAVLATTIGWTLLVRLRPELERNTAVAYFGTMAFALVVLSVVKPFLGFLFQGRLRGLQPEGGVLILTTTLAIVSARMLVPSLRAGMLQC
jgi:hypothetical protein